MFQLNVLQDQWLMVVMGSAFAILAAMLLTYMMLWQPRPDEKGSDEPATWLGAFRAIPWVYILTIVAIIVYGFIMTIYLIKNPPNW